MVSHGSDRILGVRAARRTVLKGGAGAAAGMAVATSLQSGVAQEDVRAEILKIPGAGKGQPTEQDMNKVGGLCLGPTKANVKEGEFKGVELTFMGLNNQNLHNLAVPRLPEAVGGLYRRKITWIDLAQADYNPRLQQAIATGTVDFDIIEMGAPFEGDVCGKGLASEMPDWVKKQIDMDDYVGYLKPPVGTWDGKTYRISIDGDCHNFNYRTDVLRRCRPRQGLEGRRRCRANGACPKTWQQVQAVTKFLKGKQIDGQDAYGYLDAPQGVGRIRLLLPRQPRHRLRQASRRQGLAVRCRHDEAARQQPGLGPRDPGRDRRAAVRAGRPDQRRPEHDRLPAVPRRHRLDAGLVGRHRLERQDQRHVGHRRRLRLRHPARLRRCLQLQDRASGTSCRAARTSRRTWPISAGASTSWPASTATRRSKRRPGAPRRISAARTSRSGCAAYPSGFQPYRNSHFNIPEWVPPATTRPSSRTYLNSESNSYNHPNAAIEPRIPGIFQYYSVAEDELAKIFAGQVGRADRRRQHRRGLGEDHRPDRPRQADRALQGVARYVAEASPVAALRERPTARLRYGLRWLSAMHQPLPVQTRFQLMTTGGRPAGKAPMQDISTQPTTGMAVAPDGSVNGQTQFRAIVDLGISSAGRSPWRARSRLLYAVGVIERGFDNWRPVLYAYLLWAIALGVGLVLTRGERGTGRCSFCRRCCSPSRW